MDPNAPAGEAEPSTPSPAETHHASSELDDALAAPPSPLVSLFVNPIEKRPRALLRLTLHFVALAFAVIALSSLSRVLPGWLLVVLDLLLVIVITWAAARFVDKRSFLDLGLRVDGARALDLAAGTLAGGLAVGTVAGLEIALGVSRFDGIAIDGARLSAVGIAASFFVAVAIQEELVFRGYHVVNLAEGLASERYSKGKAALLAVAISSTVFGLAHAMNTNATPLSTLNIAVGGGCLLAAGLLLTGDLAFSIGIHFAWNFGLSLLAMPVSGFVMLEGHAALVSREVVGADWVTGGAFGPEAGVLGLSGMLTGTLLAVGYARARYGRLAVRLRLRAPPTAA